MSGKSILQIKKFVFHFTLQSRSVEATGTVFGNLVWATSQPKGASKWRWNRLDTLCLHSQLIWLLSFSIIHRSFQFNCKFIKDETISVLPTLVTLTLGWRYNLYSARDILEVNIDLALEKTGAAWLCARPCLFWKFFTKS